MRQYARTRRDATGSPTPNHRHVYCSTCCLHLVCTVSRIRTAASLLHLLFCDTPLTRPRVSSVIPDLIGDGMSDGENHH